jgi:protein SCO1/2
VEHQADNPAQQASRDRAQRSARLASVSATLLGLALSITALGGCQPADRTPLPVLGRVADFALVDQTGSAVSRASLAGAPWVANFIFTRCSTVCPRVTQRMHAVQALAHRDDRLRLVTFSVDPEHDEPAVLKTYADAYGADQTTWKFLTGSESAIDAIARSFAVGLVGKADPNKADFGIMHSGHLVLVDERGRIRGYYPSSEEGVERRILVDLNRLDVSPAQVANAR